MNRRTMLGMTARGAVSLAIFGMIGSLAACGAGQINRVLAALRALPPFIRAFGLASGITEKIITGISEISASFQIFADNPTRGNLRNTLAVVNRLLEGGVFNTGNETTTQRIKAALALVVFIMETINPPAPPAGAMAAPDGNAKVSVSKEQEAVIEPKITELEQMLGIK